MYVVHSVSERTKGSRLGRGGRGVGVGTDTGVGEGGEVDVDDVALVPQPATIAEAASIRIDARSTRGVQRSSPVADIPRQGDSPVLPPGLT
jgi:hypothetical protein